MRHHSTRDGTASGVVGLLDIGTFKVACLAVVPGRRGSGEPARVVGYSQHRSKGLRAGVITDLDEAEQAVRAAVAEAERAAKATLEQVYVSIACGRLKSLRFAAKADVAAGIVAEADIARLMAGARAYAERDGRSLVHMNRIGFRVDGAAGFKDPRGMAAGQIAADIHAVTADDGPMRNLLVVVERARLVPAGLVVAAYASALASTSDEERRLGVTCIDIGGGTATISVFAEGQFIHTDVVPVGGNHITFDIARTLQTPLAEAERIKALYGTLAGAQSDEHEVVTYPLAGEEDGASGETTRAELAGIIRARVSGLVALVVERLQRSGVAVYGGDRVVLTGGGSQMAGIGAFVANAMSRPVRVARGTPLAGMPGGMAGPAYATAAGLAAALDSGTGVMTCRRREMRAESYLGRVGAWIREGF